jgi:ankyrin repeat protein
MIRLLLAEGAALSQSGLPRSTDPGTEVACFLKTMPDLLAIAATWGQETSAQMLLEYEGVYPVEARVEGDWTPLFYAVNSGCTHLVQTMLRYATNECFEATCYGRGLWSKALSCGDPEAMCKVLEDEAEKRGVTMNLADGVGHITVLCYPE